MAQYRLEAPQSVSGEIKLPASKSISNRVLTIHTLSNSISEILNLSDCDDTKAITNAFDSDSNRFDIGAAGTAMRFMTALLSKYAGVWYLTGSERMKHRPIGVLVDALNSLGAKIEYEGKEGFPPLKITGRALAGGAIEVDGGVSSQFISALLMLAPTMRDGLKLTLTGKIVSRPYIAMTLDLMRRFGVDSLWYENEIIVRPQEYNFDSDFFVESDWSAASYWYQIVALAPKGGRVVLPYLRKNSLQGDSKVADLFIKLGVKSKWGSDSVELSRIQTSCKRMVYNFSDEPDLVQTFVVTCCLMNIPFHFSGLQTLRIKETDRVQALKNEMKKLGFILSIPKESVLEWDGERCEASMDSIQTYEDHRMAMAFAPAALAVKGLIIAEPGVVTKSYPTYWDDLRKVGFTVIHE
ncbi:MAG: 3-phosphoshikimate 1-carboxyvinyltransferase [Bacteroidales bacterium]